MGSWKEQLLDLMPIKFEHGGLVLRMAKKLPEKDAVRVVSVIGEINKLMADNVGIYKQNYNDKEDHKEGPNGVEMAYTHVSALEIIARMDADENVRIKALQALEIQKVAEGDDKENGGVNKTVFALSSSAPNFAIPADGSFTTASDVGYRELLRHIKEVKRELIESDGSGSVKDFELVFLGSAFNPGGRTTEEYNRKIEEDAFSAMGKLNADLVKDKYSKADKIIVVGGVSFGAVLSLRIVRFLPKELQEKVRVWAANPDPVYGEASRKGSKWQMWLGLLSNFQDPIVRKEHYLSKKENLKEYLKALRDKNLIPEEIEWDEEEKYGSVIQNLVKYLKAFKVKDHSPVEVDPQEQLRKEGTVLVMKNINQGADRYGARVFPDGVDVDWIQGAFDLTSQNFGEASLAMIHWAWLRLVELHTGNGRKLLGLGVKDEINAETGTRIRKYKVASNHAFVLHKMKSWARWTACLESPLQS